MSTQNFKVSQKKSLYENLQQDFRAVQGELAMANSGYKDLRDDNKRRLYQ